MVIKLIPSIFLLLFTLFYFIIPIWSWQNQILFALFMVSLIGLPHGAIDYILMENFCKNKIFCMFKALLIYLIIALFILLLWLSAPLIMLILFLIISIWHFGESEQISEKNNIINIIFRGSIPIILPILQHSENVSTIFAILLIQPIVENNIWFINYWLYGIFYFLIISYWIYKKAWYSLQETIVLTLVFILLPPLLSFTLYFSFIHSIRHMLYMLDKSILNSNNIIKIIWVTLTTIALGSIGYIYYPAEITINERLIQIIFWGLSALTVPHMLLLAFYFKKNVV